MIEKPKVSVDKIIRVWDDKYGVCLEIGPGEESFGLAITTPNKGDKEWFGDIRLHLNDKEFAKQLGKAILELADNMRE